MREFTMPLTVTVPATGSLTDDLLRNAEERPDAPVLSRRSAGATWEDVSAAELLAQVRRVAAGLLAAGVSHGDRVALMSRTRYEWTLLDYAIWYVGGVTVPIYETSAEQQVGLVLKDSGATAVVVETAAHLDRVRAAGSAVAEDMTWTIEDCGAGGAVDVLSRLGSPVDPHDLEARRAAVVPEDLATLVYTSGTTGTPKGCRITHGNLMFELTVAVGELEDLFDEDSSTLLFMPLAHVFARVIQVGAVKAGVRLGHSSDVRRLPDDLATFRPTFLLGVPRVFEKLFNSASQRAASEGRGRTFDRATDLAIAYSRAQDRGRPGPVLRARHRVFDRFVYRRIRESLGGRCRYAVSGGAPLGEALVHFYRGVGVPVLEGYGLTETAGAVTANLPDATRVGWAGRPLPGTGVRVSEDGELLVRGGQVFSGYWQDPDATREVLDDEGWLQTGDLGEIDDQGFVRVTGRSKEILVTAGGKNVAPGPLEDRIRAHHLVSQCLVVGDGRPYVSALVTLDPDAYAAWAEREGLTGPLHEHVGHPRVREEVQAAVDAANRTVSQAESIRRFEVLPEDWTEEAGQLTPSLKLRRNVVLRQFRREIEKLYED